MDQSDDGLELLTVDADSPPEVLAAKAVAAVTDAGEMARGSKAAAKACYKAIDPVDDKPPLNTTDGKRWVGKVKSWSELAYKSTMRAITATDAAIDLIKGKKFNEAREQNAAAGALLGSAADQAGRAKDWCNLMLKQKVVNNSAATKKLVTASRDAAVKAAALALQGRAADLLAAEYLALLVQEPEPPELELSTLDAKAVTGTVQEDAGEAVAFAVTRTGPLDLACSVAWVASGSAAADDFISGTELAGELSWDAGDATEQRVEFVLNPDQKMEPTENVILVLSTPANALLGTPTASVGIVDDDQAATAPKAYDPALPYGGTMLGAACQDGAPGNLVIRNQSGKRQNALVMYLESDQPIVAISSENRVDHFPLGATAGGYSDHTVVKDGGRTRRAMKGDTSKNVTVVQPPTGGDLSWRVAKVVSAETSTVLDLEKNSDGGIRWGGATAVIRNCARDESWDEEWHKCGGSGHAPPHFAASKNGGAYPTIWFEKPVDPKKLGWKIGDRLAFCAFNTAEPDSGPRGPHDACLAPGHAKSQYSSINMTYRAKRPLRKSTYPLMAYAGLYWNSFKYDDRYFPLMLIGYQGEDGELVVKGNPYCGYAHDHELCFGGGAQIRQVIRIPADKRWAGRRLTGCDGGIWRRSSSTKGSVTMSLRQAGASIGGPDDQGKVLGQRTFAAADLLYGDLKNYGGSADPHRSLKLEEPVPVKPGEAYYITLAGSSDTASSQFAVGRMLNYLGRGGRGLLKPDYQNDKDRFQSRSGSGSWRNDDAHFGSGNYLHLGLSMFFAPPA